MAQTQQRETAASSDESAWWAHHCSTSLAPGSLGEDYPSTICARGGRLSRLGSTIPKIVPGAGHARATASDARRGGSLREPRTHAVRNEGHRELIGSPSEVRVDVMPVFGRPGARNRMPRVPGWPGRLRHRTGCPEPDMASLRNPSLLHQLDTPVLGFALFGPV